jgi:hypothetical protein
MKATSLPGLVHLQIIKIDCLYLLSEIRGYH